MSNQKPRTRVPTPWQIADIRLRALGLAIQAAASTAGGASWEEIEMTAKKLADFALDPAAVPQ